MNNINNKRIKRILFGRCISVFTEVYVNNGVRVFINYTYLYL